MQKYMEYLYNARNTVIKMIIQFGFIVMLLLDAKSPTYAPIMRHFTVELKKK